MTSKIRPLPADDARFSDSEIPADESNDNFKKIGDVASMFDTSLRTIRFYEDKGLVSPVRRGPVRLYTPSDISKLTLVFRARRIGFSVRDIKQVLDLYEPEGSNTRQAKVALKKATKQMQRLKQQKSRTEAAIRDLSDLTAYLEAKLSKKNPD